MQEEHGATDQGKKAKFVWTHTLYMQNGLVKEVMFEVMEEEARRGRPCRQWLDDVKVERTFIYSTSQQEGAGSRHVENSGADGIEHLWALSLWSN